MGSILAKHAEILVTMDGSRREVRDGGLFAVDGIIQQVGSTAELPQQAEIVLDLSGQIALPGLIVAALFAFLAALGMGTGLLPAVGMGFANALYCDIRIASGSVLLRWYAQSADSEPAQNEREFASAYHQTADIGNAAVRGSRIGLCGEAVFQPTGN